MNAAARLRIGALAAVGCGMVACYKDGSQKVAPAMAPPQALRVDSPALAPSGAPVAPAAAGEVREVGGPGERGTFRFVLRFTAPKVNELFAVETVVTDAATHAPVPGAKFSLDATMPEHGHGMMTQPEHRELAPGRWRTEGMKLHMHGKWIVEAKAEAGGRTDIVRVPWDQPPAVAGPVQP
ncbi:MAG: hypothetical protein EXR79_06835 [Myxococcales bacterium]|nr:hypothetical protein [Myxococcales bacterium]